VFHPLFMNHMYNLLRTTCLFCHHFKLSRPEVSNAFTFLSRIGRLTRTICIKAGQIRGQTATPRSRNARCSECFD
jgi:DNA-directed RNA polymerase beta' subunit